MRTLLPLGPNLVVKIIEEKERKYGTIIIPDVTHHQHLVGEVLKVGPDVVDEIDVGDVIIFDRYWGGREVVMDGESYYIVRDEAILAKVDYETDSPD